MREVLPSRAEVADRLRLSSRSSACGRGERVALAVLAHEVRVQGHRNRRYLAGGLLARDFLHPDLTALPAQIYPRAVRAQMAVSDSRQK